MRVLTNDGVLQPNVLVGVIATNTTLTLANSPYELAGVVSVPPNVELRIEAGVLIQARHNARLVVEGHLRVTGTATSRVRFARLESAKSWYVPTAASWSEEQRTSQ